MRAEPRQGRAAARWLVALALAVVALLGGPAARAASRVAPPQYERVPRVVKTVGVVAFRNYLVTADELFRESGDALPMDAALTAAMDYLQQRMAQEEDLVVVDDRGLRDRLTTSERYRDGILLAREWFNMGVEHFRALRLDRALENLERAAELYREVYQDLVEPYALAELEFYRGLTLAEKGSEELAHVALKRQFFLNPWKRFSQGYFAPATERALRRALVDLQLTVNRDLVLDSPDRAERFLRDHGLDALLYGHLDRDPDGQARLTVVIFEGRPGRIAFRESVPLRGTPDDREVLDRLVTRWLSCAEWAHPTVVRPVRPDFYVTTGVVESFFLDGPTRDIFHNVGFGTDIAYQLADNLDIFLSLSLMSTFSDPNRDLIRTQRSYRAITGVGFTIRRARWRFYVHPGFEFLYVGDIAWTTNVYTKFYWSVPERERPDEVFDPRTIKKLDKPFMGGMNLAFGADIFLTDELYLNVHVASSFYFTPFDQTELINFPLIFRGGIGYAF